MSGWLGLVGWLLVSWGFAFSFFDGSIKGGAALTSAEGIRKEWGRVVGKW